eukprot:CAMPEP_0115227188 /NCGR_PEP_ID=MMETSP0270-20121206/31014_1 /TAXON_ID=71861 /ORGANISM="Scrippsiella trochoidea, Strain CCMP3099" /LENGTH=140 /DNA_ID=CAMNT_0002641627 /DNA_START=218 /DNA_END=642 /DNA_ORIENTATION=+
MAHGQVAAWVDRNLRGFAMHTTHIGLLRPLRDLCDEVTADSIDEPTSSDDKEFWGGSDSPSNEPGLAGEEAQKAIAFLALACRPSAEGRLLAVSWTSARPGATVDSAALPADSPQVTQPLRVLWALLAPVQLLVSAISPV